LPGRLPHPPPATVAAPTPRRYGPINWLGLWTLTSRETRRFFKVSGQTVVAPAVTTLLMLAVFALALGGALRQVGGVAFPEFLAPGLIMMAMVQNAFANTSSSLMISKMQGNIVDSLMPPLSATELTLGFAAGGVVRGLVVGVVVAACLVPFVTIHIAHVGYILFHAVAASLLLSLLRVARAVWAGEGGHTAAVTHFAGWP